MLRVSCLTLQGEINEFRCQVPVDLVCELCILCNNYIPAGHLSTVVIYGICLPIYLSIFSSTAVSTHLTLKEIENELKEVTAADWYPLGIQLGLRPPKLKEIELYNLRDAQRCKLDILDWWLQNAPVISWEELASAVEGMGGHSNVVQRLRKKMSQG